MLKDLFYEGKKTASCTTLMKWAKQKKQFVTSGFQAGDIIFYDWDSNKSDSEHTGIFTGEISNGKLVVIEGNTGDAVKEKLQSTSTIIGAWRPSYRNAGDVYAILTWAYAQIGTAESPPGSNNVRYNTLYYGRVINDPKYAWCMVFVWCAFQEAEQFAAELIDKEHTAVDKTEKPVTELLVKRGDKGKAVISVQSLLVGNGYPVGPDGIDGDFGLNTESALKLYQANNHLEVDGIFGIEVLSSFFGRG